MHAHAPGPPSVQSLLGALARGAADDPWTYYWLPGLAFLGVVLALAVVPVRALRGWRLGRPSLFVAACVAALFALRWPTFLADFPYNADETQFGATALALVRNASLGPFLEAGTSGPLNYWYLAAPAALGLDIDLASGRLMALVCEAIMLGGCYGALRASHGEPTARLAVLPLVAALGLTRYPELVHPSSEHVPIALAGLGSWLLARSTRTPAVTGLLLALGTIAGAMPLAKLQAAPLAGTLILFGALVALRREGDGPRRAAPLAALAVGACAFGALSAGWLALHHRLAWYFDVYVRMNLRYAEQGRSIVDDIRHLGFALSAPAGGIDEIGRWFAYSGGLAVVAVGRLFGTTNDPPTRFFSVYSVMLLAVSLVAVLVPGRSFPHYLLLLVPGLVLASAAGVAARRGAVTMLCLLPLLVVILVPKVLRPGVVVSEPARELRPEIAWLIRSNARDGDRLTIWGWASWLHMATGLPQGTDYQVPYWALAANPRRRYFRALWLRDFKRRRPEFFVDAVAPGEMWSELADRHESIPALGAWVRHAYQPMGEFQGRRVYRARRAEASEQRQGTRQGVKGQRQAERGDVNAVTAGP